MLYDVVSLDEIVEQSKQIFDEELIGIFIYMVLWLWDVLMQTKVIFPKKETRTGFLF